MVFPAPLAVDSGLEVSLVDMCSSSVLDIPPISRVRLPAGAWRLTSVKPAEPSGNWKDRFLTSIEGEGALLSVMARDAKRKKKMRGKLS